MKLICLKSHSDGYPLSLTEGKLYDTLKSSGLDDGIIFPTNLCWKSWECWEVVNDDKVKMAYPKKDNIFKPWTLYLAECRDKNVLTVITDKVRYIKNNPKYPIILEALIAWQKWNFERIRENYRKAKTKVTNPHFWECPEFVEYVGVKHCGVNKDGLICYKEIQPGTKPEDKHHILEICSWYGEYKPFHDKFLQIRQRDERIDSILND